MMKDLDQTRARAYQQLYRDLEGKIKFEEHCRRELMTYAKENLKQCVMESDQQNQALYAYLSSLIDMKQFQNIVISIGCAHAPLQCLPPFSEQLEGSLILNFDPVIQNSVISSSDTRIHLQRDLSVGLR